MQFQTAKWLLQPAVTPGPGAQHTPLTCGPCIHMVQTYMQAKHMLNLKSFREKLSIKGLPDSGPQKIHEETKQQTDTLGFPALRNHGSQIASLGQRKPVPKSGWCLRIDTSGYLSSALHIQVHSSPHLGGPGSHTCVWAEGTVLGLWRTEPLHSGWEEPSGGHLWHHRRLGLDSSGK